MPDMDPNQPVLGTQEHPQVKAARELAEHAQEFYRSTAEFHKDEMEYTPRTRDRGGVSPLGGQAK
jgi:hypothetical protein